MSSLHDAFDEIVADVPVYGDLDRAIEQADRERRRRNGIITALAAAAAVVILVAGGLAITRDTDDAPQPVGPSPTPSETRAEDTPQPAPLDLPANGRLARAEDLFAIEPCTVVTADYEYADPTAECSIRAHDVDATAGIALLEEYLIDTGNDPDGPPPTTFRVATADEVIERFPSPYEDSDAKLGPGTDEISLAQGQEITVVAFDGSTKRTIDLSSVLAPADGDWPAEEILGVEWSPDRTRFALVSRLVTDDGMSTRLWVADRDGGEPQLVYTATNTLDVPPNQTPLAYLWSVKWSPDGSSLGFIEELASIGAYENAQTRRVAVLTLSETGDAVPRTLYDYPDEEVFDEAEIVWSPDATRVATRVPDQVLELSAEDGQVLEQHPMIAGKLVWLPRQR